MSDAREVANYQQKGSWVAQRAVDQQVARLHTMEYRKALAELMKFAPQYGFNSSAERVHQRAELACLALGDVISGQFRTTVKTQSLKYLLALVGGESGTLQIWAAAALRNAGTTMPTSGEAKEIVQAFEDVSLGDGASHAIVQVTAEALRAIRLVDPQDTSGATRALKTIHEKLPPELKRLAALEAPPEPKQPVPLRSGLNNAVEAALTGSENVQALAIERLARHGRSTPVLKQAKTIVSTLAKVAFNVARTAENRESAIEALHGIREASQRGRKFDYVTQALLFLNAKATTDELKSVTALRDPSSAKTPDAPGPDSIVR